MGGSLSPVFLGTKLSTASNGALVTEDTPTFVLLYAPRFLGERNTPRHILALAMFLWNYAFANLPAAVA
ncbi:MAG: hypothetical protein ACK2TX_06925 [Anaerolineales bacterium]